MKYPIAVFNRVDILNKSIKDLNQITYQEPSKPPVDQRIRDAQKELDWIIEKLKV